MKYICEACGGRMEFEDSLESILVCPSCGESVELEHYGLTDEEYDALYPTEGDVTGDYSYEDSIADMLYEEENLDEEEQYDDD